MSEQPLSGDGLVLPEAFPVKSSKMNVETVRAAAGSLRSMGKTVDERMDAIVSHWNGLPGVYEGPGAEQAYGRDHGSGGDVVGVVEDDVGQGGVGD